MIAVFMEVVIENCIVSEGVWLVQLVERKMLNVPYSQLTLTFLLKLLQGFLL